MPGEQRGPRRDRERGRRRKTDIAHARARAFCLSCYPVSFLLAAQFSPPERFPSFRLADAAGVFYTAPIESAASAMEMSALSGRNAAALVRKALGLTALGVDAALAEDAGGKQEL